MPGPALLEPTDRGLFCPSGGFYVDPWRPVERALVTHAHADHACPGCSHYLTSRAGAEVLRIRVGADASIDAVPYGERRTVNGVTVSLHPAGHILGSAQIRLEHRGQVWVVSGDYKVEADRTCTPFELVRCHVFISESTFALPIYRWRPQLEVFGEVNQWWRSNQAQGKASVLYGYSLGKAQRIVAGVDPSIGPIYVHGAVEPFNRAYRAAGIDLPETVYVGDAPASVDWGRALIVAPPSAAGSPWLRRFGAVSAGFASGWMRIRGARRRRAVDRGFVLSDHADWPGLLQTLRDVEAERVQLTHGYTAALARYLQERGVLVETLATRYQGERDDASPEEGEVDGTPSTLPVRVSEDVPSPPAEDADS